MALLDIAGAVDGILDKFIPDAKDKLAAKAELARIADAGAARQHTEAMGQIETNKIEAGHASVFVSGWRPALGWIGATGCAAAFVIIPLNAMIQAWWYEKAIPEYPIENLMGMIFYLLGASGIRTFEKLKGTAFGSLGADPGVAMTREVKGSATPGVAGKLPITTHENNTPREGTTDPESDTRVAAGTEGAVAAAIPAAREIAWGAKVSETFKSRVLWIEQDLKLKADYLMAVMAFETGRKFRADVRNLAGSSGTGLIQFMEFTAERMGTTTAKLAKMSAEDQLNYVYRYFKQFGSDFSKWTLEDTYMAVLYPKAIGKPGDWAFPWAATSLAYRQNKGLDKNKDGQVTKLEASAGVRQMFSEGLRPQNQG